MTRGVAPEINEDMRRQVEAMAGFGMRDDQIADIIGIPESTMKRHFETELPRGRARAIAAVARTLYQMATSGKVPAATFFYLKCRAHWRELDLNERAANAPLVIGPPATMP